MKQINATIVSDELVRLIKTVDTDDKYLETIAHVADSMKFIVTQMMEDNSFKDSQKMFEWASVLQDLTEYQNALDTLHQEAKISPHC